MLYGVYSIFDAKTGFMSPVIEVNDESAIRNFAHSVANSEGILYSFSQDFQLYRIGTFDSDTAALSNESPHPLLITGPDAIRLLAKGEQNNAR
ncbi:nonstructural protein [Peromfec virus RodF8_32]|uniref:Nonstructural protein n=1 Tax=Peromfec virus RodF8_32 TaxID=2929369 RepID=A0A976N340_9VIRU|nr:nonstructural protein [Peromfec virus RodF8_32]